MMRTVSPQQRATRLFDEPCLLFHKIKLGCLIRRRVNYEKIGGALEGRGGPKDSRSVKCSLTNQSRP
jgi:hypothetical protein